MTVARRRGNPGKADELWKRIIYSRGPMCERCHAKPGAQAAHIMGRAHSATRCVEDNGWYLCGTCHYEVDNYAHEKLAFAAATIGSDRYMELYRLAKEGPTLNPVAFWRGEVARLKARCAELGIPTGTKKAA